MTNFHDNFENKTEQIYTNFDNNEFAEILHKRANVWGSHGSKPRSQTRWEIQLSKTIAAIADTPLLPEVEMDIRPKLYCTRAKRWILIDSGASKSLWPNSDYPDAKIDPSTSLKAVNNSIIPTYGVKNIIVKSGNYQFTHSFTLAPVSEVILGWDYLTSARLDLGWSGNKCCLKKGSEVKAWLQLSKAPVSILNLAPIATSAPAPNEHSHIPSAYFNLIKKYPNLTKLHFKKKVPSHNVIHHIDTGNHSPCHAKVRKIMKGTPKYELGKKATLELEELGVIERIKPGDPVLWTTALHLQPKTDGTLRACGDFRPLNDCTALDGYPLPSLKHFTEAIAGSTIFSKLDLLKAFHLVPLDEQSSQKTTIVSSFGTFRFRRLAMGLKNACQSFQKLVEYVLAGIENVFIYIDDLLIYSKNEEEHKKTLEEVMKKLSDNDLTVSLAKCVFGAPSVDFLGYRVDAEGIIPLPKKTSAIANFPRPQKPKQLLAFLGAVNFYRRSLPSQNGRSAAEIMQPLYSAATVKTPGIKFVDYWQKNNLDEHFNNTKNLIMSATKLIHPDPAAPIALTCDASKFGVGAVLETFIAGAWRPLGFYSKHIPPHQHKLSTFRRELMAIHLAMRHFREETSGKHVVIFTDHRPLVSAFRNPTTCQDPIATNQINEVAMFTNDVRYVEGRSNIVADCLSRPSDVPLGEVHRLPDADYCAAYNDFNPDALGFPHERENIDAPTSVELRAPYNVAAAQENFGQNENKAVAFETINHQALAEAQNSCPEVAHHLQGHHPAAVNVKKVEFSPGLWLVCDMSTQKARPLVPNSFRKTIFNMYHQVRHPGPAPTLIKMERSYYWQGMKQDVAKWIKECIPCNLCKPKRTIQPPISHRPVAKKRFSQVQIDIVGPLPISNNFRYILTALCRTSRWLEAYPMTEATSKACADAFLAGWVPTFGLPSFVSSDNGPSFVSAVWKDLQEALGTVISYSPPLHPQSLGALERQHRDLKLGIKTTLLQMANTHQSLWSQALPWVLLSRRTDYQPDLGACPAELVLGQVPRVPGDLVENEEGPAISDLLEKLRQNAAREPVQTSHHKKAPVFMPKEVHSCDRVWVKKGNPPILGPIYEGPYGIEKRLGQSCLLIRAGSWSDGQPRFETVHWNNCWPAPPEIPLSTRAKRGRKPLNPQAPTFNP